VRALKRRGIESLFPIQNLVLRPAMEGTDLTARAKTGSGKTLAFALPVVESLLAEDQDRKTRKTPGRTPRWVWFPVCVGTHLNLGVTT
jgi:ATP-dependent RNA helicase DDX21